MSNLLPFGSITTCPKCNSRLLYRKFVPERSAFAQAIRFSLGANPVDTTGYSAIPEHMDCKCLDCGYCWAELCADAATEKAIITADDGATRKFTKEGMP